MARTDPAQMELRFEVRQQKNPDGSFTVTPVRLAESDEEVSAAWAANHLGLHAKDVHELCKLGEENGGLDGWKRSDRAPNAKWRISKASVLRYKPARRAAARA
ncbi:MAG: hypothetical protein AAGI48_03900 [Verrucomicrobiota bacterium]